jgi:aminoacyl tRNA synthase complex-interacting multifunctional protein 1
MALRCVVAKASPIAAAVAAVLKRVDTVAVEEGDKFTVTTADGLTLDGLQTTLAIVAGAGASTGLFGADAREQAHVNQWVGIAADVAAGTVDASEAEMLLPMSASNVAGTDAPSIADAVLYAAVAPAVAAAPKNFPKLNKWTGTIAKTELVAPIAASVKAAAPAAAGDGAASGKKGGAAAAGADKGGKKAWDKPNEEEIAARRAQKEKEKAEKERLKAAKAAADAAAAGGDGAAAPAAAGKTEPKPLTSNDLDLRVGVIVEIEKHPKADRLYVEKIDVGEEGGPRTIVSGLVQFYKPEELLGRHIVVVANMKAKPLMGVPSHGMVLCASVDVEADAEGGEKTTKLELVPIPAGATPGERISIGAELSAEAPGVTKKMTDLLAPLRTDADGNVLWGDKPLAVKAGALRSGIKSAIVK